MSHASCNILQPKKFMSEFLTVGVLTKKKFITLTTGHGNPVSELELRIADLDGDHPDGLHPPEQLEPREPGSQPTT